MTDRPGKHRRNGVLGMVAVVVSALFLAWAAWSLTRGEWTNGWASGSDILRFSRELRVGMAGFILVALYLSARSTVSKLQKGVPRLDLASWHRRQFAILSPLVFLFAYVGVLVLIPFLGMEVHRNIPRLFDFWLFWHGTGGSGLSLMTTILSINVLATVYLWLSFRSYRSLVRRTGVVLYLPYVVGLLFLVAISSHYYKISQVSPDFSVLEYPLGNPAAVPVP